MPKKYTAFIIFISLLSLFLIEIDLTQIACIVTIVTGILIIIETILFRDITVKMTLKNGWIPHQFTIINKNKTDIEITQLFMVTKNFRYLIQEKKIIEDGDSFTLELPKDTKFCDRKEMLSNNKFTPKNQELEEDIRYMIQHTNSAKIYFELHIGGKLYIPKYGRLTMFERAIIYLKPKYFNKSKIEIITA